MIAIKKARKFIEKNPTASAALTLADLVVALETSTPFALAQLYALDYKRFDLAMEILAEWRLDQYYASKVRLIDTSNQVQEMHPAQPETAQAPGI